jgi:uncharacterized protein YbcC (UPF0753/DUF2309 family)
MSLADQAPIAGADSAIRAALKESCSMIAPTWPLDKLIAVNPFWELRHLPAEDVAARLAALGRSRAVAPAALHAGNAAQPISDQQLAAAAGAQGVDTSAGELREAARRTDAPSHWHNISDLLDSERDRQHEMAWGDEIIHQLSQFCARVFQRGGELHEGGEPGRLYDLWLTALRMDRGIPILMGTPRLATQFEALPDTAEELLETAAAELALDAESASLYAHALLLDINGWASWIAYLEWQQALAGGTQNLMSDLLAMRMAWDLAIWRYLKANDEFAARRLDRLWKHQLATGAQLITEHAQQQQADWAWQRAAEATYQANLHQHLRSWVRPEQEERPMLQAVFCIDVRSEVMRRHLEAQHGRIQTIGFAGFFGLPIAYQPAGSSYQRPQLPGLLAPGLTVTETADSDAPARTNGKARWDALTESPPAMFALVEATGPLYAAKLLKESFFPAQGKNPVNGLNMGRSLSLQRDGQPLPAAERITLAHNILSAMGLTRQFAPVVLLTGHGSSSRNNPHAAGLDCGACGGQTGELNARVLASLLNDEQVRRGLSARDIRIPADTRFVAALHDTTTDEIHCYSDEPLPPLASRWLEDAGAAARAERAPSLDIKPGSRRKTDAAIRRRARDWSQLRPEWGLANNAAFIAAPRQRTQGFDLQGRTFLHDYDWQQDPDFSILELIMTAPMVVAQWINAQYNASVTDNQRYGSGNKLLHNVVGGNIGVFEGNGGDLRIGLPHQSVHNGRDWMHTPLRLSAYLQAPAEAIARIYKAHANVAQLVDNDWLYLFRLSDTGEPIERLYQDQWTIVPAEHR